MTNWKSVDAVLDYAIAREVESEKFYADLAGRAAKPWMAEMFEELARQEKGHQAKLENIRAGRLLMPARKKVLDLKIADYVVDIEASPDLGFQDALILAMKREKAAFKLYSDLAASSDQQELKLSFEALAQEEARHKLRIEIEYDNSILTDN